jgi:hypothetical protein
MEATEQLRAFVQFFLHDLHLTQVQLDELYAVLGALKDGTLREEGAIKRLSLLVSRNLRRSATGMSLLAVHIIKSSPVSMEGDFVSGVKICGRCSSALMERCSPPHHSTNLSCTLASNSL